MAAHVAACGLALPPAIAPRSERNRITICRCRLLRAVFASPEKPQAALNPQM